MGRSIGQIINRGKDKWLVRIFLGYDENGKRKYHNKTIYGSKKDAEKYKIEKLNEINKGIFVEPANITLKEYLDEWIKTSLKGRVKATTYQSYVKIIELYIKPVLGDYKISKLNPLLIQDMLTNMMNKNLSARTIRYTHTILKNALNQAVKWQIISNNPCNNVDLPKQTKQEMKVLTPEQAKKFLEACVYNRWGILFEVLLTSGMRPGEALGLKWEDIDFKNNRIYVKRNLTRTNDGWKLEEPKTPRSRRTIPLPKEVMKSLKEHKKNQTEEKLKAKETLNYDKDKDKFKPEEWQEKLKDPKVYIDYGFVFAAQNGSPLDMRKVVERYFKPLLKEANLPDIRLYDLRHTCATLLLAAGENPKVVSERLGHANITLTLDTYSHVLPDMQKEAAAKLEEMLF
ncbi:integrase family protein [Thermoanaerobacter ethanolicus JW 200]|uniref:tyrosine-type recombinase/integrase n=1 Tax=Thermoanaerobacter ethanolicus TaxID=1757 RepID=UPI000202D815|nr:integrase family protein [Thermoanaerobacter ethanolicus JW 200]